jgi:hypothetical protein
MFPAFKANYTSLDSRRIRDQCNLQRSFSYQLERLYITVKVKVIGCMETYNEASLTDQEKVVVVRMASTTVPADSQHPQHKHVQAQLFGRPVKTISSLS